MNPYVGLGILGRIRIRPGKVSKQDATRVHGINKGMPLPSFHLAPKKKKKATIEGAGPIRGRGGATISYPENQDNIRRGKRPTIKYTPPPVTHRPPKPKPGTKILGRGPVRPTIKYPEQKTHAVKRPKPQKELVNIKYPVPAPANTGSGGLGTAEYYKSQKQKKAQRKRSK